MASPYSLTARAFQPNLVPGLSGCCKDRRSAAHALPAQERDIDIARIQLDRARVTTGALGRNQDRAAAAEGIQDDALAMTAIANRVGNQADRLDRRVQREQFVAPTL